MANFFFRFLEGKKRLKGKVESRIPSTVPISQMTNKNFGGVTSLIVRATLLSLHHLFSLL